MIGERPIHPAVQRALFRKIDAINRLKVGAGDPFFNSTTLEPQDTSNPIEQHMFRACWARVTAAISKPGTEDEALSNKPISFGGYLDVEKNTQINRPLTFNKDITKDNIASETFRGESGITGISVTQKSFYVNEITINFACPDPIDFENRIEPTFLRHGQSIAIEFGWGMDDKQLDFGAAELTTDDIEELFSDVYTKQLARAGSYYCNVGTVSNYSYKVGTDGGYTGTITLHSRGQNVMNQTTQNEENSGDETPNRLTPILSDTAKAAADNRKLAEGIKDEDGTFETRPDLKALEELNQLKLTEASYQSVMRNLDKVLDEYLTVKETAEPVNYKKAVAIGASTGGTAGAGFGAIVGAFFTFGFPPTTLASAGFFGAAGTALGAGVSLVGAAATDVVRRVGAFRANQTLKDEIPVSMVGYTEGLRGPKAFYPKPGVVKTWFKNGAMKLIVDDYGVDGGAVGAEVPESLQKKYLMSWGWFEDHILASFFNITITSNDGKVNFQEVRSVGGNKEGVSPTVCHLSKDLYSMGLDSIVLPGKTHPKVRETFASIDTSTPEGRKQKLLSREVYTRKNRIELARIRQVYDIIDNHFQYFEPNMKNESGEIVPANVGIIRNMVFDISMFQKHFQDMDSLQQGMRSFWSDVSNQYGGFWNFGIAEDKVNTGRIMVIDQEGVQMDKPADPESHSQREDFINYSPVLDKDRKLVTKDRRGVFVFPLYSKNSIVKSFDLSVNISSKAATIANYGANTSIVGGVVNNKDKPNLSLQAYSLLLNTSKFEEEKANGENTKKKDLDNNEPIFRDFKFPVDITREKTDMIGRGPVPEERYGADKINNILGNPAQELDDDSGIDFSNIKDINEDTEKIREKIEEQRVQYINGIGIYDRYGNFSNYFKTRMKYLINIALEDDADSNIRERKVIIPIDINMTIDGISGLLPGDVFKVDYLPKIYREHTYFQVFTIEHSISTSGWETKIGAKMRLDMTTFLKKNGKKVPRDIYTLLTNEEFLLKSAIENIQASLDERTKEKAKLENELELRDDESNFSSIGEGVETVIDTFKVWWQVAVEFFDDTPGSETLSKGVVNIRDEQKEQRKLQLQDKIDTLTIEISELEELKNVFTQGSREDFNNAAEKAVEGGADTTARTSAAAQELQNIATGKTAANIVGQQPKVQTQAQTQFGNYKAGVTAD